MYSLGRMGFNKPPCNTRQYGTNNLTFNQHHLLLKPEYLGNDHSKFLNNFGLQTHLITDKKFADITSVKQSPACYPTNYVNSHSVTHTEAKPKSDTKADQRPPQTEKMQVQNTSYVSTTPKKTKRKHDLKSESVCKSEKLHVKNTNKPWHKTSLKLEIMEMEDILVEPLSNTPDTPLDVHIEVEKLDVGAVKPASSSQSLNNVSTTCRFRIPSECESEDSFIVFENSSNSFESDIMEQDESDYFSSVDDDSGDGDEDEGVCSIVSSLDDVWPSKRVWFADGKDLCEVHPMVQWSFAYQKARKGPWEQHALDRMRFQRRIACSEPTLSAILHPQHRHNVYNDRFLKGNA